MGTLVPTFACSFTLHQEPTAEGREYFRAISDCGEFVFNGEHVGSSPQLEEGPNLDLPLSDSVTEDPELPGAGSDEPPGLLACLAFSVRPSN